MTYQLLPSASTGLTHIINNQTIIATIRSEHAALLVDWLNYGAKNPPVMRDMIGSAFNDVRKHIGERMIALVELRARANNPEVRNLYTGGLTELQNVLAFINRTVGDPRLLNANRENHATQ